MCTIRANLEPTFMNFFFSSVFVFVSMTHPKSSFTCLIESGDNRRLLLCRSYLMDSRSRVDRVCCVEKVGDAHCR